MATVRPAGGRSAAWARCLMGATTRTAADPAAAARLRRTGRLAQGRGSRPSGISSTRARKRAILRLVTAPPGQSALAAAGAGLSANGHAARPCSGARRTRGIRRHWPTRTPHGFQERGWSESPTPAIGRGWTGPRWWSASPRYSRDRRARWRLPPFRRVLPTLTAAVIAAAYVIISPRSEDLAAHLLRAKLFATEGFGIWNNWWYAGHNVPGYSVLFPPLGALLTPQVAGAIAIVPSAALFESMAHRRFGPDAWLGALWFGAATGTEPVHRSTHVRLRPFASARDSVRAPATAHRHGRRAGGDHAPGQPG